MSILLTRETVEKEVEKFINASPFSTNDKLLLKTNIDLNKILKFFYRVKTADVLKLSVDIESCELISFDDCKLFCEMSVTRIVLDSVCESIIKMKNIDSNLSLEEKMNLLIDLKSANETDIRDKILGDSIEDDLSNEN